MSTSGAKRTLSAWEQAIEFGIDVTLLEANLRRTPAQRIADLVAMMVGGAGGVDEMQYRFDHGAVMRLGLDPARLESLIVETLVEAESLLEMLRA